MCIGHVKRGLVCLSVKEREVLCLLREVYFSEYQLCASLFIVHKVDDVLFNIYTYISYKECAIVLVLDREI